MFSDVSDLIVVSLVTEINMAEYGDGRFIGETSLYLQHELYSAMGISVTIGRQMMSGAREVFFTYSTPPPHRYRLGYLNCVGENEFNVSVCQYWYIHHAS